MSLTVYKQLTTAPADVFHILFQETGIKTRCVPFAHKLITAMKSLGRLTESDAYKAANTILEDLQTLYKAGVTVEDYDKIDFIKRGKVITASARVEALLRAAANKGYRVIATIVAVPMEDAATTRFREKTLDNGEHVYEHEDRFINPDREISAERLIKGYFSKFLCRLEITVIQSKERISIPPCEMSLAEMLAVAGVSEQGLFRTRWETYIKDNGYEGKRKVVTDEPNHGTFWTMWTGEMVAKTIIRRAFKRVREVLPELKETAYAFEQEEKTEELAPEKIIPFEIPMEVVNVDMDNLTDEQKADVSETFDLFKANPKLAMDKAEEIKAAFENGESMQSVINSHFASIVNIRKSKKLYPIIQPFLEDMTKESSVPDFKEAATKEAATKEATPAETSAHNMLFCFECGQEITNEKSKKYYAQHPEKEVLCYSCNQGGKR